MATSGGAGIPGATSIDHIGISVPDLDEAEAFFVDVLGCEVVYRATPPIDESAKDWMATNLGVSREATMRLVKMRCGPNAMVELLDYDDPDGREAHPKNSDPGASHLCFQVEDLATAVAYVEGVDGVEVQGEPRLAEEGPEAGQTFVYFTAPWGLQLELIETPPETAFRREPGDDWHPAHWLEPAPSWGARPDWSGGEADRQRG